MRLDLSMVFQDDIALHTFFQLYISYTLYSLVYAAYDFTKIGRALIVHFASRLRMRTMPVMGSVQYTSSLEMSISVELP